MAETKAQVAARAAKAKIESSYTEEEVTRALVALVWHQGSQARAAASLKAQYGLAIPAATLANWRDKVHAERYGELRHAAQLDIEQEAIRVMRDHMALAAEAERLAIEKTIAGLKSGLLERPDQAAANMAKVKQVNADKLLSMTGRPVSITENRGPEALLRILDQFGVLKAPEPVPAIEASAEETT